MSNILKDEKQEQVIRGLLEGSSVRSVERMTGIHRDTIIRLMVRVGQGSKKLLDAKMRDLKSERIQVDEVWGYVGKKQRHLRAGDDELLGDTWTFVALDADTKIVPTFLVGKRTQKNATTFLTDLASRLDSRVQLSSDQLAAYVNSVYAAFGPEVDYGQIVKSYEAEPVGAGRYSPPKVVSVDRRRVWGSPDPKHISTSHVERQNLTMRMNIRRLTRLTNAFSKKFENLEAAVALHFAFYNFCRPHQTIKVTPAVKAGIERYKWSIGKLLENTL